jgi:hypothetical protein
MIARHFFSSGCGVSLRCSFSRPSLNICVILLLNEGYQFLQNQLIFFLSEPDLNQELLLKHLIQGNYVPRIAGEDTGDDQIMQTCYLILAQHLVALLPGSWIGVRYII